MAELITRVCSWNEVVNLHCKMKVGGRLTIDQTAENSNGRKITSDTRKLTERPLYTSISQTQPFADPDVYMLNNG